MHADGFGLVARQAAFRQAFHLDPHAEPRMDRVSDVVLVPIRSGVGLRAGLSVGYLKFTQEPTWNPF